MAKKKTLKQILIELGAYEKFKETWKKQKPAHYQKNAAIVLKSTKVIKYNAILHGEIWDARISNNFNWWKSDWKYWHNICLQVYQMSQ